jgi:hypothetical protein
MNENKTKLQVGNLLRKLAQAIRLLTCMWDVPLSNPDQLHCQVFVGGGERAGVLYFLDGTALSLIYTLYNSLLHTH